MNYRHMKDKAIHDAMESIEKHVRDVYNQGYFDGLDDGNINNGLFADKVREAYNNGLEDAWECARKILFDSSLPRDILTELGADSYSGVIHKCSASEAIEKIKEYEKRTESMSKAYAEVEEWLDRHLREELTDNSKQTEEKTEKNCKTCRYGNIPDCGIYPCNECKRATFSKWTPKQTEEKTDKSCDDCRFADLTAYEFPCCSCSASHTFRWEPRKGANE